MLKSEFTNPVRIFLSLFLLTLSIGSYGQTSIGTIGAGYFNRHTYSTYNEANCTRKIQGEALTGSLGGNNFTVTFGEVNPKNNAGCGNTTGATIYGPTYKPGSMPANNGWTAGNTRTLDMYYNNSDAPGSNYTTIDFTSILQPLTNFVLIDVDRVEAIQIEFLDADGNVLDIAGNVRPVRLFNAASFPNSAVSFPSSTKIKLYSLTNVDMAAPGWAFVTLKNNVKTIRFQQVGGSTGTDSYDFIFTQGIADRGDAPVTYGNPGHLPLSTLKLGSNSPDADASSQYSAYAGEDDINGNGGASFDDEGGVDSTTIPDLPYTNGVSQTISSYSITTNVTNTTGATANVIAWIDWNNDGAFQSSEGTAGSTVATGSTNTAVTFTWSNVLLSQTAGMKNTYLRVRVTTDNITTADFDGLFSDGEVEDYPIPLTSAAPNYIGTGYFNGVKYGTFNEATCTLRTQGQTFTGALDGNAFTLTVGDVNPRNNASCASTFGTSIYGPNYAPGSMPANNGWTGTNVRSFDAGFYNNNNPGSNYTTFTFNNNLKPLTNFIVLDLDKFESVLIEFLDASGNVLSISDNIKVVRLFNPLTACRQRFNYSSSTSIKLFSADVALETDFSWAFVTLTNNIKTIRFQTLSYIASEPIPTSYDFELTQNTPDRGDAPASYGDAESLPLPTLKLGTNAPDADATTLYSATATGDNQVSGSVIINDEDGIATLSSIANSGSTTQTISSYSVTATVTNNTGATANVIAWIDWNNDGAFQASEGVAGSTVATGSTNQSVTFTWNNVVLTGTPGLAKTFLRIRTSTDNITTASFTGFTSDGEVEDYAVNFANAMSSCTNSADPTSAAANPSTICIGNSSSLSLAGGGGGTNAVIKWYTASCGGTLVGTGNNLSVSPSTTTTYYGRYEDDPACSHNSACATVTVTVITTPNTWIGTTTNWYTPANWSCLHVPAAGEDVIISNIATVMPVMTADVIVGTVTFETGTYISIASTTLTINGNITGPGTFSGSASSNMVLTGSAAKTVSFTSGARILKDLTLTGTGAITLGTPLYITAGAAPGTVIVNSNAVLNSNGNLTIGSDANGTARVGISSGSINGNVTVERFIPQNPKRAWRHLSVPTSSAQTINAAWQEGQTNETNTTPGFGTLITTSNAAVLANGFDVVTPGTSILTYNSANNSWSNLTSTYIPLSTYPAYFLYIRGDRSVPVSVNTSTINFTTLRTTGTLFQGTQPEMAAAANTYTAMGNPYASAVNFASLIKTGSVDNNFWIWDPKLYGTYGLGSYQTFSPDGGGGWIAAPGNGGSYNGIITGKIESGQAFFVHTTGGAGTIQFTEASKATGSRSVFAPGNAVPKLRTSLLAGTGLSAILADGNVVAINSIFSNNVTAEDALKMVNTGENFGLLREGKNLSIEKRQTLTAGDTIYYNMSNLKQQAYTLRFIAEDMETNLLSATLLDKYLNKTTPVDLTNGTDVEISITSASGSFAADRFKLIFSPLAPLPIKFVSLNAYRVNSAIQLQWKISEETGITTYETERSVNGTNFNKQGSVKAAFSNSGNYEWIDASPTTGTVFYRIKAVDQTGKAGYSNIVKVLPQSAVRSITIALNPVTNKTVKLQFVNQDKGNYTLRITNKSGQVVHQTTISHAGGNATQQFILPASLSQGVYTIEIENAGISIENLKLMISTN